MYATSVGLIMRGFDFLETYKKSFNAGTREEYMKPKAPVAAPKVEELEEVEATVSKPVHEEEKIPLTEKIKTILSKMFEVEDQPIK
jgi:hypothetical protein